MKRLIIAIGAALIAGVMAVPCVFAQVNNPTAYSNYEKWVTRNGNQGILSDLQSNPNLANDPRYLSEHPSLAKFLQQHPGVAEGFRQDPERFERGEGAGYGTNNGHHHHHRHHDNGRYNNGPYSEHRDNGHHKGWEHQDHRDNGHHKGWEHQDHDDH